MLVRQKYITYPFTHAKQWTDGAIFCYKRGCNCEGCYIKELLISSQCFMKHSVLKLVNELGSPDKQKPKYTQCLKDVIESIMNGATTREEITLDIGIPKPTVVARLKTLYEIAKKDGWKIKHKKDMLQDYIEWIKENYNDNL